MALLKYFMTTLPTAKETEIGEKATKEVKVAVLQLTGPQRENGKWKAYMAFSDEQRAATGQYAAENSNAAAIFQIA